MRRHKARFAIAACLAVCLALSVVPTVAQQGSHDGSVARSSLCRLTGVYVLVDEMTPEAESAGLSRMKLEMTVEVRLRIAGIPVLNEETYLRTPGRPCLHVPTTPVARNCKECSPKDWPSRRGGGPRR